MSSEPTDPNDIDALQRQIAELQAKLSAVQQSSATDTGAARQQDSNESDQPAVSINGDNADVINTGTSIATQGGAVVSGSVEAGNHFIGRDFIQTVTQVVHSDEDPEEAKSVIAHYLYALANELSGLKLGEIDVAAKETRREPMWSKNSSVLRYQQFNI